jgi:hypothetical protein
MIDFLEPPDQENFEEVDERIYEEFLLNVEFKKRVENLCSLPTKLEANNIHAYTFAEGANIRYFIRRGSKVTMETPNVDYVKALQNGINKHKVIKEKEIEKEKAANKIKTEIEDVFLSLTASIQNNKQFKGLKIEIYCGGQTVIWVENLSGYRVQIATCFMGEFCYPFRIDFSDKEIYCEDKQGLEEGLIALLSDPTTGCIVSNLLEGEGK